MLFDKVVDKNSHTRPIDHSKNRGQWTLGPVQHLMPLINAPSGQPYRLCCDSSYGLTGSAKAVCNSRPGHLHIISILSLYLTSIYVSVAIIEILVIVRLGTVIVNAVTYV